MSTNSDPTDGCTGKVRFSIYKLAERSAKRSAHAHGERLQPYKCRRCEGFHVGSCFNAKRKPQPRRMDEDLLCE